MENEVHTSSAPTPKRGNKGLKAHLFAYFGVNVLLLIINLAVGYRYPWHLWPLLSWGIGFAIHGGTIFVLRAFQDSKMRGFGIHASVVLAINVALFGMNLLAGYGYPWHLWGLIGLGIGLGIHGAVVLALKIFSDGKLKGLAIHGGVYLCANLALYFVNLLAGNHILWFRWPLFAWLIGLGTHAAVIYSIKRIKQYSVRGLVIDGAALALIALFLVWVDFNGGRRLNWVLYAAVPLGLVWVNHYVIYLVVTPQFGHTDSLFTRMMTKTLGKIPTTFTEPRQEVLHYTANKVAFVNHFAIYMLVNAFLAIVNEINVGIMENPWFLYSVVSWGVTVVFHGYFIQFWNKRLFGKKITVLSTIGLFLSVSGSLVFQDYFSGDYRLNWCWWGIGITFICWVLLSQLLTQLRPIQSSRRIRYGRTSKKASPTGPILKFCPKCGQQSDRSIHPFCAYCGEKFGADE